MHNWSVGLGTWSAEGGIMVLVACCTHHAAFDNFLSVSGSAIFEAFVLSRKNVSRDGRLTYLLLYMSFCLGELVERKKTMRPISGLLPLRSTLAPRSVTTLPPKFPESYDVVGNP